MNCFNIKFHLKYQNASKKASKKPIIVQNGRLNGEKS
jgi:hypothetical protein